MDKSDGSVGKDAIITDIAQRTGRRYHFRCDGVVVTVDYAECFFEFLIDGRLYRDF